MLVLLTEDSADLRQLMKVLLESTGHRVETAANGKQAVEAAIAGAHDIILMDLRMPVMDGFAATRELRKHPATKAVPIIAVSAYVSDRAWCERAIGAGVNECVSKPVDLCVLQEVLERYADA